jgi:cupin fold WbuC family metalloprotein
MNREREFIWTISQSMLDELLLEARAAPRLRAIRRLHGGDWEHAHRMLNALIPGTYVRPHYHPDRYQGEGFILLRGRMALLIFDDLGSVDSARSRVLRAGVANVAGEADNYCLGIDLPPRVWHGLVALEETVIYEVKGQPAGGYVQANDKCFAPWAPEEGSNGASDYLRHLECIAYRLESNG